MKRIFVLLALFSMNAWAVPVNINTASAEVIAQSLKGIGMKKAQAIVEFRKKNGSFNSLNDLTLVKGLGEKTVNKISADVLFKKPVKKK